MACTFDAVHRTWSAVPEEPLFNPENTAGQILFRQLKNFSNNILQIDASTDTKVNGDTALTWGIRIAQILKAQGLDHNDVVGIAARNSTYVLPVVLGCLFNTSPLHAINTGLNESTISHCFGITKPKIVFCDGAEYEKIRDACQSFNPSIFTISGHCESPPSVLQLLKPTKTEQSYKPEKFATDIDQTMAILCSSGTTGKPKAVCVPTCTLLENDWMNTNDSVLYTPSGIDWISGLYHMLSSCLRGFTRVISNKGYDSDHFLDLVAKYRISTAFMSSRYIASLVQHPRASREALFSIRCITFGGSPLSEASLNRIRTLFGKDTQLYFIYGTTELSFVAFGSIHLKPKSVGKIGFNLTLRIADEEDRNLGHGEIGEVVVKHPYAWKGYYGNALETQRSTDSNGWCRTGDLGYVDADNDLYIVDRKKEVLKYQGMHFWPAEIENQVHELTEVLEACVVSVRDDTRGDLAGALVVKKPKSSLTAQDVEQHVRRQLVDDHKQLHAGVYFVESLPQNANGKILRGEVRNLLAKFISNGNGGA